MKNYSIWLENAKKVELPEITEDKIVDVFIIGGGISGLSSLYYLKNSGLNTILVEKNICGHGVTSRSTAKITYMQEDIPLKIKNYVNLNTAKEYIKSQIDAAKLLKEIIEENHIDCDFEKVPSYIFSNKKNSKKIEELYKLFLACNCSIKKEEDNNNVLLKAEDTYVFHPLKYIENLKNILKDKIYEHSKVYHIKKEKDGFEIVCNGYKIKSKYIIVACHYPFFVFPFILPFKSHIQTSYIGLSKEKINEISAINIDKPTISIRNHKNAMLYLFQSFVSCNIKSNQKNFLDLMKQKKFDYVWSNHDIITNDYMPYIGSIKYKNLLLCTGYNTWGMTNGTLAGKICSDIILGKKNDYQKLFSPKRKINLSKILRFIPDSLASVKAILVSNKRNVNNSKVTYKKIKGTNVAIYIDHNGKKHTVLNRCPHMKCGIVFNEVEQTWDCLCHGSRFDLDGKCIEGPSNFDITYKK